MSYPTQHAEWAALYAALHAERAALNAAQAEARRNAGRPE